MERHGSTRRAPVTVITEAPESLPQQLRRRQLRYGIMMASRVACLLAAVAVVGLGVPWAPFWVVLCLVGMVTLPWMAVLIANDRPPRRASTFVARLRAEQVQRQLTGGRRE